MKIGIWGFGVVGKGAAQFLLQYKHGFKDITLEVFDNRTLTGAEKIYCEQNAIVIAAQSPELSDTEQSHNHVKQNNTEHALNRFLEHNDTVIPSPGIKLDAFYQTYQHKWLCELDLFAHYFIRKIIAITGSVGKTSITSLLSDILQKVGTAIVTGGNIGKACLDLVPHHESVAYALLEVSSFQLAYTQTFTPDIAIITNIFPNHLDWHKDEPDYFKAKCVALSRQHKNQKALMPFNLRERIYAQHTLMSQCFFFSSTPLSQEEYASLGAHETVFYINSAHTHIRQFNAGTHINLIALVQLPAVTFNQNWLIICSTLSIMSIDLKTILPHLRTLFIPEHRLEKCAHINGITIYNDSKSTTPESTIAAVAQLHRQPILLIVGGLSKGVNREPFIATLEGKVKAIYTFGAQGTILAHMCKKHSIPVYEYTSLEEVVTASMQNAATGDQLLFSPAGSSYDLFKNYIERGTRFKELINKYIK